MSVFFTLFLAGDAFRIAQRLYRGDGSCYPAGLMAEEGIARVSRGRGGSQLTLIGRNLWEEYQIEKG